MTVTTLETMYYTSSSHQIILRYFRRKDDMSCHRHYLAAKKKNRFWVVSDPWPETRSWPLLSDISFIKLLGWHSMKTTRCLSSYSKNILIFLGSTTANIKIVKFSSEQFTRCQQKLIPLTMAGFLTPPTPITDNWSLITTERYAHSLQQFTGLF